MTKIQLDLSEEENEIVDFYKVMHKLPDKREAIKAMILENKPKYEKAKEAIR